MELANIIGFVTYIELTGVSISWTGICVLALVLISLFAVVTYLVIQKS